MPNDTVIKQDGEQVENEKQSNSFKAITTQEQFDNAIKGRISRAEASTRKAVESEYAEVLEKAKQFDEIQEANKSELQKATDRADKAEAELKRIKHEREREKWASEISKQTGVPVNLIQGSTKEEMENFANENAHYFKADAVPEISQMGKNPDGQTLESGDPIRALFERK